MELKTENKVINHILTEKFEKIYATVRQEQNEINETYADKLRKKNTKDANHRIIIKDKTTNDSDKTKTEIKKVIDPIKNKIKDGKIEITVPTKNDIEKIKETLNNKENFEVEERKKNRPRLILEEVPTDIKEENELLETIWQQNETICNTYSKETFNKEIKIRTHLKNKRNQNIKSIIIEVTGKLRQVMQKEQIKIGWRRMPAQDHTAILQCFNCCGLGHTSSKCRIKTTCKYCAGNQNSNTCQNYELEPVCILCYIENEKNQNKYRNTAHHCNEKQCGLIK